MKTLVRAALQCFMAAAATCALVAAGIPTAVAATDVAAPVIVSSSVTTTTLDVTNSAASLELSIRLTDETAVSDLYTRIRHPQSGQTYYLSPESLVSGTVQDGIWQAIATIPQGSASGDWVIEVYGLSDSFGNQTAGFMIINTITVISPATDVSPPVVVSNAVTKTTLDVTNSEASLIFSFRLTDETAVADLYTRIRHPQSGQAYYLSPEILVSGTLQNGVWRATATLPKGSAAGNWVIEVYGVSDTLQNMTNGFINVRTITVKSAATDVSPPVVVSNAVTKTTLDVTNSEASLIFSVRLTDETAVSDLYTRIRHPQSGQAYYLSPEILVSGTLQNGVWRATATLPKGSAAGNWVIEVYGVSDTLQNMTNGFINVRTITVKSA